MAKREKGFWTKLSQEAGLDDAAQKALLQAVENEKFSNGLYASLVPREESMRQVDDARKVTEEANRVKAQAEADYRMNLEWYNANVPQLDAAKRRLAAYESVYGPLDAANPPANPLAQSVNGGTQPQYLTREELLAAQRNTYVLQRQLRRADLAYQKQFGTPLPDEALDELEKLAVQPENMSRSFDDLFNAWVSPKVSELQTKQATEREAKIRQEAFNEGLAKGRMREPTQGAPEETSPLYLGKPKPETSKDERTLMTDFMQGLETPAAAVTH